MKREFLKEIGLKDEQIEKIMAEHGKSVGKIKQLAESSVKQTRAEDLILSAAPKSPEILKMLINCEEDVAPQISNLKNTYPWLFSEKLPMFSDFCSTESTVHNPFRHGAGI